MNFYCNRHIIALILMVCACSIHAQVIKDYKSTANRYFANGDYFNAMENYRKAFKRDSFNLDLAFRFAESCRLYHNYFEAEEIYTHIVLNDLEGRYQLPVYWLAELKEKNGDYEDALVLYETFAESNQYDQEELLWFYDKANFRIKHYDRIDSILADTLNVQFYHLGTDVNSPFADISPYPSSDTLIYYASIKGKVGDDESQNEELGVKRFEIYKSYRKNGKWFVDRSFKNKINKSPLHKGNLVIDTVLQREYFTYCKSASASGLECQIYYRSTDTSKNQMTLVDSIHQEGYSYTQPSIVHQEGKSYLVFSSNQPGGKGQMDIWWSPIYKNGIHGAAINAGDVINSPGNELTPFSNNSNGKLYFSSNYWIGLGGYDVFEAHILNGLKFSNRHNIGFPVSTPQNDMYYSLLADSSAGFIASNRVGGVFVNGELCCHDIYAYEFVEEYMPMEQLDESRFNDSLVLSFEERELTKEDIDTRLILERNELSLDDMRIYFGFDDYKLDKASKKQLDIVADLIEREMQIMKIWVNAHTDGKGEDAYNEVLSMNRAGSVKEYLIKKGVAEVMMDIKYYGETRPIEPNSYPDGTDNPSGRAKNRRVEMGFELME